MSGGATAGQRASCTRTPDIGRCLRPALIDELRAGLIQYVQVPG